MGVPKTIKYQRLLEQAESLFTKKGFRAVTVEEIAEAAGISKMTVYNQYGSKENLFIQITLQMVRRFNKEVESAVWKESNTFDRLRVYFEKGQKMADLFSASYFRDIYGMPHVIQTVSAYKKETTLKILMEILETGCKHGEIRIKDQQFLIQLLDILTLGLLQAMPGMPEDEMMKFNHHLFEFMRQGLMAGVKEGSE